MANWASLQEQLVGKPIFKRAKYGIHFRDGNSIVANFSGKPCHFFENGLWKPIDTKLLLSADGYYGCPHSPVRIHKDGHVKIEGTDYSQYTELPEITEGLIDNDKIVRPFSFGEQRMWVTEDGYRSEIQLNRIPTLAEARKVITSESGKLSKSYLKSLTTATDANGDTHRVTTLSAFRTWLASAVFPVVIDPDFQSDTTFASAWGQNDDWATARNTLATWYIYSLVCGDRITTSKRIYRMFLKFDTSSIGAPSTVTQANLKMYATNLPTGTTEWDLQIVKQDWSSGTDEQKYDGCLAGTADDSIYIHSTNIIKTGYQTSGNLSTAWINKSGITYYSFRSSRDFGDAGWSASDAYILGFNIPGTTGKMPILTVTYTSAGATKKFLFKK